VAYNIVTGNSATLTKGQVWAAYGGLTRVGHIPVNGRASAYAEGGRGVTSRAGFKINGVLALRDAHFASALVGSGITYHATPKIDIVTGLTFHPGRKAFEQPSTKLLTTGMICNIRPLPSDVVERNRKAGFIFSASVIRVGFTQNATYAVNAFFSDKSHVFWSGHAETKRGVTLDYERNAFHAKKRFRFDLGSSVSSWKSRDNGEIFETVSADPVMRFFVAHVTGRCLRHLLPCRSNVSQQEDH